MQLQPRCGKPENGLIIFCSSHRIPVSTKTETTTKSWRDIACVAQLPSKSMIPACYLVNAEVTCATAVIADGLLEASLGTILLLKPIRSKSVAKRISRNTMIKTHRAARRWRGASVNIVGRQFAPLHLKLCIVSQLTLATARSSLLVPT